MKAVGIFRRQHEEAAEAAGDEAAEALLDYGDLAPVRTVRAAQGISVAPVQIVGEDEIGARLGRDFGKERVAGQLAWTFVGKALYARWGPPHESFVVPPIALRRGVHQIGFEIVRKAKSVALLQLGRDSRPPGRRRGTLIGLVSG